VRPGPHREATNPIQPTGTADCERVHIMSRPPRRTGPIASFPAQPSRRARTALRSSNGLHSVQYSDGLHLASYVQWSFQRLPRTLACGMCDPTLHFTTTRAACFRSAIFSPVLRYRLPTVDVPLPPGSRPVHVPQSQRLLTEVNSQWNQIELKYLSNSHLQ
jgi:hypothetical protein